MPESSQSGQPLGRTAESSNEIPNKMRRLSADRKTMTINASILNASDGDLSHQMLSEDYDSPDAELKKLDESIENMKSFRNKINSQRLKIQSLSHELETMKRTHHDCTMKINDLGCQLNAERVKYDQAKEELTQLNEKHAQEVTALNKAHCDVTAKTKIRIDLLQQEKEGLRKGLEHSHTAMLDLQRKMNENHEKEMNELRTDHQRAVTANETLRLEIVQKADTEAKLKKKCEVLNEFKGKFESLYASLCQQLQQYEWIRFILECKKKQFFYKIHFYFIE